MENISDNLLKKIKNYSGANKNTEQVFGLSSDDLDQYISDYYNAMVSWVRKKYRIPETIPADVEMVLIELTSNLIRSHAVRQDLGISEHEDFDFDEAVNNIFTEDLEKRMKPYLRNSRIHCFSI